MAADRMPVGQRAASKPSTAVQLMRGLLHRDRAVVAPLRLDQDQDQDQMASWREWTGRMMARQTACHRSILLVFLARQVDMLTMARAAGL